MANYKLIYFYGGFPEGFTPNIEINPISEMKLQNDLKEGIYTVSLNTTNKIVNYLIKNFDNVLTIARGLNFSVIFDKIVNNELSLSDINIPEYLFIYSIGSETAVNKEYAGAVLKYFIDKVKLQKSYLFLEGINKTTLTTKYKIDVKLQNFNL